MIIGMGTECAKEPTLARQILAFTAVSLGVIAAAFICWLVLRASTTVIRALGTSGIDAMTRIMGFFLVAIGVQFAVTGIRGFIEGLT